MDNEGFNVEADRFPSECSFDWGGHPPQFAGEFLRIIGEVNHGEVHLEDLSPAFVMHRGDGSV